MPIVRVRVRATVRVRVRVRVRVTVLGYIARGTCYSTPYWRPQGYLLAYEKTTGTYWKSIF